MTTRARPPWRPAMPWTAAHKLNGISWVGIRLMQPDYGTDYKERFLELSA